VWARCHRPQTRKTPETDALRTVCAEGISNAGKRAFSFRFGYLGWFVSPWGLFVSTAARSYRHVAEAIRILRLEGDEAHEEKSCGVNKRSITFHSP
jgi:Protein of unknown function, DUF599